MILIQVKKYNFDTLVTVNVTCLIVFCKTININFLKTKTIKMKKSAIFLITIIILISISSCSKEEIIADNLATSENQSFKSSKAPDGERLYSYMQYYYNHQSGSMVGVYTFIFCAWPNRNCLPVVVITPATSSSKKNAFDQFISNYNNSTLDTYFSDVSYKTAFPGIDSLSGVVDSIISGDIIIHKFYNSKDTTDYYIGLREGIELTKDWDEWVPEASCVLRLKDER